MFRKHLIFLYIHTKEVYTHNYKYYGKSIEKTKKTKEILQMLIK